MEARKTPFLKRAQVFTLTPIGLLGGILALVSCFAAWGPYDDSFGVPLQSLWDGEARGGGDLGVPLVSVAAGVALLSALAIEPFIFLRRLAGVAFLGATALFVVQLGRDIGWDNLNTGSIHAGPYLAGAGGLLALLAPSGSWPFRRRRLIATSTANG
jgi:hypothetical protein